MAKGDVYLGNLSFSGTISGADGELEIKPSGTTKIAIYRMICAGRSSHPDGSAVKIQFSDDNGSTYYDSGISVNFDGTRSRSNLLEKMKVLYATNEFPIKIVGEQFGNSPQGTLNPYGGHLQLEGMEDNDIFVYNKKMAANAEQIQLVDSSYPLTDANTVKIANFDRLLLTSYYTDDSGDDNGNLFTAVHYGTVAASLHLKKTVGTNTYDVKYNTDGMLEYPIKTGSDISNNSYGSINFTVSQTNGIIHRIQGRYV